MGTDGGMPAAEKTRVLPLRWLNGRLGQPLGWRGESEPEAVEKLANLGQMLK
jgi:hypothetical protein